ncbi:cytochrome P450 family protein [Tengunoibacter tsumagoiensis]|uniref:Polyketide biosynthesis cytochrome P450 PksS n=1 Tax=Tengunoibacter tsumagoiensis TaxID=2014871 RepID=A0A402A870_9CHLR|nr:cytochrome P450 [Tengunoibacter tsumagoiensis]GCE15370.1 polyketide biosynthesis cytochrome P450 PksS [Tengunoibacter tsumagoiensis]
MELTTIDITNATFKANPFPFYARLRTEAPVYPVTLKRFGRTWLVTRYNDVLEVLKDERFVKDPKNAMTPEQLKKAPRMPAMFKPFSKSLLSLDDPDHARLRVLVHKAFTPRRIEQMRDQVQVVADELLEGIAPRGQMDLIADYALPLPLTMIARILGIPSSDNNKFHRWTKTFLSAASNPNPLVIVPAMMSFMRYLRKQIKERQAHPQDDLITALVQAREGNDMFNEDEVVSMIFLLLSAGHETTVNLIGSGMLALMEHPDQMQKLRNAPELSKSAIEELVRFVCPAETATERYAREDVTIAGTTIPRGEMVLAVVGSANRDPNYFDNPDTIDIARTNNRHLAFGQGIHYCLGAPLARLEGQIAIPTLLQRLPNLHLARKPEDLRWRGGMILRGLEALPVTF